MIIYCCPKCKMTDLGNEGEDKKCMRCNSTMLSLGISSAEWNNYNNEQIQNAINSCVGTVDNVIYNDDLEHTDTRAIQDDHNDSGKLESSQSFSEHPIKKVTVYKCSKCNNLYRFGDHKCDKCGADELEAYPIKISEDEYKKLMRIDDVRSENLESLYKLARKAREVGQTGDAYKYYNQIRERKPSDWEAAFFADYYDTIRSNEGQTRYSFNPLNTYIMDVFFKIKDNVTQENIKHTAYSTIIQQLESMADMYLNETINNYKPKLSNSETTLNDEALADVFNNICEINQLVTAPAICLLPEYDKDKSLVKFKDQIIKNLKSQENRVVQLWECIPKDKRTEELRDLYVNNLNRCGEYIVKYEPAHKIPTLSAKTTNHKEKKSTLKGQVVTGKSIMKTIILCIIMCAPILFCIVSYINATKSHSYVSGLRATIGITLAVCAGLAIYVVKSIPLNHPMMHILGCLSTILGGVAMSVGSSASKDAMRGSSGFVGIGMFGICIGIILIVLDFMIPATPLSDAEKVKLLDAMYQRGDISFIEHDVLTSKLKGVKSVTEMTGVASTMAYSDKLGAQKKLDKLRKDADKKIIYNAAIGGAIGGLGGTVIGTATAVNQINMESQQLQTQIDAADARYQKALESDVQRMINRKGL